MLRVNYYKILRLGFKNLKESFVDYCKEEVLDGDNKYFCEGYGLQDAKKGVIFTKFPLVLHLQLKRFEYDFERDVMVKVNDYFEFDEHVDLSEFREEKSDDTTKDIYELFGVLVHSGDVNGGHYRAFIKQNKKWYMFDDDRVVRVSEKEVYQENYGHLDAPNNNLPNSLSNVKSELRESREFKNRLIKKFTNAYMLVYFRKDCLEQILCDVDVPVELVEREKKEKEDREREEREKVEDEKYLDCVLFVDCLMVGSCVEFDFLGVEFFSFRVKRDEKFYSLREIMRDSLKQRFRNKVESINFGKGRFWSFCKRQNMTTRLDSALDLSAEQETFEAVQKDIRELRLFYEQNKNTETSLMDVKNINLKDQIIVILKYFDGRSLFYAGCLYLNSQIRVSELVELVKNTLKINFNKIVGDVKIYEEVKANMIELVKMRGTIGDLELISGDILTVCENKLDPNVPPSVVYSEFDLKEKEFGLIEYYEWLYWKVCVAFSDLKNEENKKQVWLSKKLSWDGICELVGELFSKDPRKLVFYLNNGKNLIKRRQNIYEISHLFTNEPVLYFDELEVTVEEYENLKRVSVCVIDSCGREKETLDILVERNGLIDELAKKCGKKRVLWTDGRDFKVCSLKDLIADDGTYYVESSSELYEFEPKSKGDHEILCFHFWKDKIHGVPFKVSVNKGCTVGELKRVIVLRSGLEKFKLAYGKGDEVVYLDDLNETLCGDLKEVGIEHLERKKVLSPGGIKIGNN